MGAQKVENFDWKKNNEKTEEKFLNESSAL